MIYKARHSRLNCVIKAGYRNRQLYENLVQHDTLFLLLNVEISYGVILGRLEIITLLRSSTSCSVHISLLGKVFYEGFHPLAVLCLSGGMVSAPGLHLVNTPLDSGSGNQKNTTEPVDSLPSVPRE